MRHTELHSPREQLHQLRHQPARVFRRCFEEAASTSATLIVDGVHVDHHVLSFATGIVGDLTETAPERDRMTLAE
jgi:hypothetical protein